MTERKFRKLLWEKPYLMCDMFVRSYSDAERLAETPHATAEQMIARARLHLDLPDEVWDHAQQTLTAKRQCEMRKQRLVNLGKNLRETLQTRRRLAIASLIILLVLAFFTLIPAGRTLAQEIFDYIISIFGNRVEIVSTEYNEGNMSSDENYTIDTPIGSDVDEVCTTYSSLAEFTAASGLTPFTLDIDGLQCTSIVENNSSYAGRSLQTDYRIGSNGLLTITQRWNPDEKLVVMGTDEFDNNVSLPDGTILYYAIDGKDGSFDGVCLLPDSFCQIHIDKEPYISEIICKWQTT